MNKLTIYKASAGSGKTHTLTREYLLLAFADVENYRKILAVTFTNKAAEEMKMRIIEELNNLAEKGNNAAHFGAVQQRYPQLSAAQIAERAMQIRNKILHNYTFFAVSTIDSFVQRVVRSFSFELGLHGGYAIQMDNAAVIEFLTQRLYEKLNTDPQLKKWLLQFAQYKIESDKSWDFRDEISTLAKQIFTEKFHEFEENSDLNKDKLNEFNKALVKIQRSFETQMKNFATEAQKILDSIQFNPADLGAKMKTIANYLANKIAAPADAKNFVPNKTVWAALEGQENWHAKTAKANVLDKVYTVYPALSKILTNVVGLYETEFVIYLSAKALLKNFHAFGVLNDLATELPEYRDENNALLISDTNLLLKKIIGNNDAPFIYEKVGNYYQHILIDEFQDTSTFQWANFRPLIQNSLASAKQNLIVGDVKQSIYRWRGGDWKLLLSQVKHDIGRQLVAEKTLDTNWRSQKNILDFNNRIFREAPKILQHHFNNSVHEDLGDLQVRDLDQRSYDSILVNAYADSYQLLPDKPEKQGGRVVVNFVEKHANSNSWHEKVAEILPARIDDLLKNQNYSPRDIAVLVRKNGEGKQVVDMLLQYQNQTVGAKSYDIISAESLYIESAQPVRLLISALRYISDKNQQVYLHTLIWEYQQLFDEQQIEPHQIFKSDDKAELLFDYLPENFLKALSNFEDLSLYEITEELIAIFQLHQREADYPYIRAFQDAMLDYTQNFSSSLDTFLEWWEKEGSKISIQLSDKQDAVQVVTVHKSKGLAFNVVIIPFCSWSLDHSGQNAPIIWTQNPNKPFDMFRHIPIKYATELKQTFFYKDYLDEKLYAYIDALNMLYVAFTRPKKEMHIIAPNSASGKLSNIGDLLYMAVQQGFGEIEGPQHKFIDFQPHFNEQKQTLTIDTAYAANENSPDETSENHFILKGYPATAWQQKIEIQNKAHDFFIESLESVKSKVDYGTLMHRILSTIYTVDDIDDSVYDFYNQGIINGIERMEILALLKEAITETDAYKWFANGLKIYNEASLLSAEGQTKIPDRVVDNGTQIIVIDFKFGKHNTEYIKQVQEYMKLWQQMGYKNVSGALFYVLEKKIIEVSNEK